MTLSFLNNYSITDFGHSLLQGIFPTEGSNPGLLHCRQIFNQLSHKQSPHHGLWVFLLFPNYKQYCNEHL